MKRSWVPSTKDTEGSASQAQEFTWKLLLDFTCWGISTSICLSFFFFFFFTNLRCGFYKESITTGHMFFVFVFFRGPKQMEVKKRGTLPSPPRPAPPIKRGHPLLINQGYQSGGSHDSSWLTHPTLLCPFTLTQSGSGTRASPHSR